MTAHARTSGFLLVAALALLSHGATPTTADAQAGDARKAYEEGKLLQAAGDHDKAIEALHSSYTLSPKPKTGLLLGRSLVEVDRLGAAHAVFSDVIDNGAASKKKRDRTIAEHATKDRAALEARMGRVQVSVKGEKEGAVVMVAGREVTPEELAQPLWVTPGKVDVELHLPDGQKGQAQVDVAAGGLAQIAVGVNAPAPANAPPSAAQAPTALAATAPPAGAEPRDEPEEPASGEGPLDSRLDLGLIIGGKVGGGIGAPLNEFGGSPIFELELGYALPLPSPVGRSLEVFVSGQYSQPQTDGSEGEPDPRLPGDGTFSYDVTQQELAVALGALYRIPVGMDPLMPYGGVGGRMYMLRTVVNGEVAGEPIGENEETQNAFGLIVMGGVDIFIGPGALLAELQFGFASVDAFVLRNTNVGALNLAVGYRLML